MRILIVSLVVVCSDQLSKLLIKGFNLPMLGIHWRGLELGTSKPIIGDLLRLTYIENPGMAFGIDFGGKLFFSVFSIVASVGIFLYLYKVRNESFLYRFSLAMILGGAIGNLIDRVFYGILFNEGPMFHGRVIDFIDADFFNVSILGHHLSRWPVFNLADASVTCGVLLMLVSHRRSREEDAHLVGSTSGATIVPSEGTNGIGAAAMTPDPVPPPNSDPPHS